VKLENDVSLGKKCQALIRTKHARDDQRRRHYEMPSSVERLTRIEEILKDLRVVISPVLALTVV
jgi:hypothetical protein